MKLDIHLIYDGGDHGRAPHGARGLKFTLCQDDMIDNRVAPRTGRVD